MQFLVNTLSCVSVLLLTPLFPYLLYASCSGENDCSYFIFPQLPSTSIHVELKTLTLTFIWFLFQAFLSTLPVGELKVGPDVAKHERITYRMNGLFAFFVSMATVGVLIYCKLFPLDIVERDNFSLITAMYVSCLCFSFLVYFASQEAGKEELSGGFLHDFVFGRLLSPQLFGKIQVKTAGFKASFITWGLIDVIHLANVWERPIETNYSLILLVVLQLWYIVDHLVHEESNLHTASLSSEKIGFVALSGMLLLVPLTSTLQVKFLSHHSRITPWKTHRIAPLLLHLVGYYIYRSSVNEKFEFRSDPRKAKLSGVSCITTSKGKDLLVSGWWGRLRHPNYLGDLLMNYSWALVCGFSHVFPWVWVICLTVMLVVMAKRDDAVCREKYGEFWEEYQRRVKYIMVPYVF